MGRPAITGMAMAQSGEVECLWFRGVGFMV